jgi:hypothetical protein
VVKLPNDFLKSSCNLSNPQTTFQPLNLPTNTTGLSPALPIGLAVAGLLALWLAFKIAHFVIKLICISFVLAVIAAAVWWIFMRH